MDQAIAVQVQKRTKRALFISSLLHEPLFTLYTFVSVILYKDLHASAFQIALLTTLTPVSTILSFYWSTWSKGRLRRNLLGAGLLMRAPFLLVPWFDNVWVVIAAFVNYMLFYRAGMPSWMEILKRNMPAGKRERAFSFSAALGYAEGFILALAMGLMLDQDPGCWKWLIVGATLFGLLGLVVQCRVPVIECEREGRPTLKELVARPWRDSMELMRRRKDFATFQWGFMVSGFAIMLVRPVYPIFMVDDLGITHIQMAMAIAASKGLGYVASSSFWSRAMERMPIHRVASMVSVAFALFPLLMIASKWALVWFYAAWFLYGVGQGGSHLVWSMSGPHFSEKEESSRYTGVGVVLAGLRGAVGPPLGTCLLGVWGALSTFAFSGLLFLGSGLYLFRSSKKSLATN